MTEQAEKPKKITHTYLVNLKAIDGETQNIVCGDGLSLRINLQRYELFLKQSVGSWLMTLYLFQTSSYAGPIMH